MNIPRIIQLRTRHQLASALQTSKFSTGTDEKIVIPKRIPRGPTDILRALERTVGKDPTAPHYKYHDDPFLIPMSNMGKRTFALAQEAGRKAALFVRKENPELFNHRVCDPPIEPFFPPVTYNENSEVEENDLASLIKNVNVSDAVLVYKLLKSKGKEISAATEQALLELICFQNGEDAISEDLIEERWFMQSNRGKELVRKTWKDGELAEEIFISLDNPSAEAYSALIQGMARYHQVDKAWLLFEEAQKKGIIVNTNTYNSMISVASGLKEDYDLRWKLILDLLSQMQANKLKPNLGTLNSVLQSLSGMGLASKKNSLDVLAEFKNIGIVPSLASWAFILQIYYKKDRVPVSMIFDKIMREIENKDYTIRDIRDIMFFTTAMNVCRFQLQDVDQAKRLHKFLNHGNNYDLIGDSYKESVYFRNFFALLCQNIPFDEFMNDIYQVLVPHIYMPELGIIIEILKQVEISGAVKFLPRLWSDIIISDMGQKEDIIDLVLQIAVENEPAPDSKLNQNFSNIALDIYEKIEFQHNAKAKKITFSGNWLGKIMMLFLRNNDFNHACVVMDKFCKDTDTIVGVPNIEALSLFMNKCIEEKAPTRAIICIQYCSESGFPEAKSMAEDLHRKLNLDESFLAKLTSIVGDMNISKPEQTQ